MSAVRSVMKLGMPWGTLDPFLFCVHHLDHYPAGNDAQGPEASLDGRNIGMDFDGKDGWRMYHGDVVPGFPQHPHRGFETITVTRIGHIDHADSLGATARFGEGDCQWMTAGRGIVHAEMFPLRDREKGNPLDFFQIWLNLPASDKMVEPHFTMIWADQIPHITEKDDAGRSIDLRIVAGAYGETQPAQPPPSSWASRAESDIAIWTIDMEAGARFVVPAAKEDTNRALYYYDGANIALADKELKAGYGAALHGDAEVVLQNGDKAGKLLMLQGRPIGEPVAHHGPFVMNTRDELVQAIQDYQRTQFGGWPWPTSGPVHDRDKGRFAKHADGRVETRD